MQVKNDIFTLVEEKGGVMKIKSLADVPRDRKYCFKLYLFPENVGLESFEKSFFVSENRCREVGSTRSFRTKSAETAKKRPLKTRKSQQEKKRITGPNFR